MSGKVKVKLTQAGRAYYRNLEGVPEDYVFDAIRDPEVGYEDFILITGTQLSVAGGRDMWGMGSNADFPFGFWLYDQCELVE